MSLWNKTNRKNLFLSKKDEPGLLPLAYRFLGGLVNSVTSLCAIFNPAVNSYKCIGAPVNRSGVTGTPNPATYSGHNRTHMIRVPDAGRFEFRLMDGAANPYLMQAGVLATGLDGVSNKRNPGTPVH